MNVISDKQTSQIISVSEQMDEHGYGLMPAWINLDQANAVSNQLDAEFGTHHRNHSMDFDEALFLPEMASEFVLSIGSTAVRLGLNPRQVVVTTQAPYEVGRGHFDKGFRKTFWLNLGRAEVAMFRPNIDGIPEFNDDGNPTLTDTHWLTIAVGSLGGFAGSLASNASYHRVSNPAPKDRFAIGVGCT